MVLRNLFIGPATDVGEGMEYGGGKEGGERNEKDERKGGGWSSYCRKIA